jgi:hypothetical protein
MNEIANRQKPRNGIMGPRKYTDDVLARIAASCTTRREFRTIYPSAYCCASRRGLLKTITAHMGSERQPSRRFDVSQFLDPKPETSGA